MLMLVRAVVTVTGTGRRTGRFRQRRGGTVVRRGRVGTRRGGKTRSVLVVVVVVVVVAVAAVAVAVADGTVVVITVGRRRPRAWWSFLVVED